MTAPRRRLSRRALLVLAATYWLYVVNGIVNSEIGPALLGMIHSFHIDLATAGIIFTAQFCGYLPGALGGGLAADRWGYRRVLIPATLLVAIGTGCTALAGSWAIAVALTAVAGVGFGTTDSLCNAVVAAEVPGEGGTAMNLLHTFFGVGALTGPLIVGALLVSPGGWQAAFLTTGALACSCAVFLALAPIPVPSHLAARDRPGGTLVASDVPSGPSTVRDLRLWLLACMLFFFVGIEQLSGGWSATYLNRVLGAGPDLAARSVSLYWAAVTAGRLVASIVALRLSNRRLLGASIALSLAALVALASAGGVGMALGALGFMGLAFAPIYPTIMAIAAGAYPRRFATLAGLLVAAGGLGGALFPWLGGVAGQAWGLRGTIWLGAGLAAMLLALFALFFLNSADRAGRPALDGGG